MIHQVAAAIDRRDYKTAAKLLKPLLRQSPEDPWVQLYMGQLQEACGKPDGATRTYRQLLKETVNPLVAIQARQGLQRLEATQSRQKDRAIDPSVVNHPSYEEGFLVLEPVTGVDRLVAVSNFAQIMQLDPCVAQLQLPSRSLRLDRTGRIDELQVYGQKLLQAGIPNFWTPLADIKKIQVLRVRHLQSAAPWPIVVCQNEAGQIGSLRFDWSEVTQRIDGMLPIFANGVDFKVHKKPRHKEQMRDYAQICDLHLPERNYILRFCDNTYQFQQGVFFTATPQQNLQTTNRLNWNQLINCFDNHMKTVSAWSGFTPFAETALGLSTAFQFNSHIHLLRKAKTEWDQAFHLYSSLIFLKP
jgi:hypothetical protein